MEQGTVAMFDNLLYESLCGVEGVYKRAQEPVDVGWMSGIGIADNNIGSRRKE